MASKRRRDAVSAPTSDEWEACKQSIICLYWESSLSKVMSTMASTHNFVASKNQYERKLKEWGIRKNLTNEELQYIIARVGYRKTKNKYSIVKVHGVEVQPSKIRKASTRFSVSKLAEICDDTTSFRAATPEGIEISTPPPSTVPMSLSSIPIGNLPYLELIKFLTSFDPSKFHLHSTDHDDLDARKYEGNMSEFVLGLLQAPNGHLTEESRENRAASRQLSTYLLETYGELTTCLQNLMVPMGPDSNSVSMAIGFAVYFSSNHLMGFNQKQRLLELVTKTNPQILKSMFGYKFTSVTAFLEGLALDSITVNFPVAFKCLFEADTERTLFSGRREELLFGAVKLGICEIVIFLLDQGMDPNCGLTSRNRHSKDNCTMLGVATIPEVADILIQAGADVNLATHSEVGGEPIAPIYSAIHRGKVQLAKLLLKNGALFNPNLHEVKSGRTLLAEAISKRDLELIKLLLNEGAKCIDCPQNFYGYGEKTELQLAAFMGESEILAALLEHKSVGEAINTGNFRWAPLRDAARQGHEAIVKMLLEAGADVNASSSICKLGNTKRGLLSDTELLPSTALSAAIEGGQIGTVRLLLQSGADINAPILCKSGTTVLEIARALGHPEIYSLLSESGAAPLSTIFNRQRQISEICLAAIRDDVKQAQYLVDIGIDASHILDAIDFEVYGTLPTHNSTSAYKNILSVFWKVSYGDLNARGPMTNHSPLEIAIKYSDFETAQEMIQKGLNVDRDSVSLIKLAIEYAPQELVLSMLHSMFPSGTKLDTIPGFQVDTILHAAISQIDPKVKVISHLLSLGVSPNAIGEKSNTALQSAVLKGTPSLEIIDLLIKAGANVNGRGGHSSATALQLAASYANLETVELLLSYGADINDFPGRFGTTALQSATSRHKPSMDIIELLLRSGADVNAPAADEQGLTALQGAAISGYLKIALLLLEHGADPNAKGSKFNGRTALEGAAEWGRLDMVQLLINAGAETTTDAVIHAERERHFVIADLLRKRMAERKKMWSG